MEAAHRKADPDIYLAIVPCLLGFTVAAVEGIRGASDLIPKDSTRAILSDQKGSAGL